MRPRDPMNHDEVQALLPEFVLDLLSETQRERLETHVDTCPDCTDELAAANTVHVVAGRDAAAPAPELRSTVLAAAFAARPPRRPNGNPEFAAWEAETAKFVDLVRDLIVEFGPASPTTEHPWNAVAIPKFDLTVQGVVCHLIATNSLWGSKLGLAQCDRFEGDQSFEARTHAVIARHRAMSAAESLTELEEVTHDVASRLRNVSASELGQDSRMLPQFSLRDYIALLALETWTHADDIRVALGRPPRSPETEYIDAMVTVLPRWVGGILALSQPESIGKHYRIELTGSAAVELDIVPGTAPPATATGEPDVTITCDTIEFCKLAGARRTEDDFDYLAIGDIDLARSLVGSLSALAAM